MIMEAEYYGKKFVKQDSSGNILWQRSFEVQRLNSEEVTETIKVHLEIC